MLYRYSGAGNSFVVVDGRNLDMTRFRNPRFVHSLCLLNGTDGLMILEKSAVADFRMQYFNSDGSTGMLCGNGGRCIVAFADFLGVKAFHSKDYVFEAADGIHSAEILSHLGECKTVRLQMNDVTEVKEVAGGIFLNTGTRHLVTIVPDVEEVDVEKEGARLRHSPEFAPEGTNVNFLQFLPDGTLKLRTFEKGVEAETLACGTGVVAAALAAFLKTHSPEDAAAAHHFDIHTRQDLLSVDFRYTGGRFTDIYLTGPTLFEGELDQ